MLTKARSCKKAMVALVALPTLAAILVSTPAMAAGIQGAITQVEYNAGNPSTPQLMLQVSSVNTNYLAQQSSPGCGVPSLSIDTIKILLSIAQAALLSAKNATVYYNVCNGANYVYDVVMTR